jgi:two-component system response regulator MprA
MALGSQGYHVNTAHTAEDALHLVESEPPQAIILDYRMPLINGTGFLYRLRARASHQHIPVLVVTGESSFPDDVLQELHDLGAEIRQKPIALEAFLAATRSLLGHPLTSNL